MSIDIITTPKNPNEKRGLGVDFTDGLDVGDSITAQTVTVYEAGTDTDKTSEMLVPASTSRNGAIITCKIQAGTDGVKYNVCYDATTVGGEVMRHIRVLPVKDERK